jgi:hypothetical protein
MGPFRTIGGIYQKKKMGPFKVIGNTCLDNNGPIQGYWMHPPENIMGPSKVIGGIHQKI